jgi:hypothetical protein
VKAPATEIEKSVPAPKYRWIPLALAASLVLALSLVYTWRRFDPAFENQQVTHSASVPNTSASEPLANNEQRVQPVSFQTPYSIGIRNNDHYESVPVMPQSVAQELGYQPSKSHIPVEVQAKLRREGYQLDSSIHYLKGSTGDGREIIVPVESVRMQPYGQ